MDDCIGRLQNTCLTETVASEQMKSWVNSYSGVQFGSILGLAGFRVEECVTYKPGQYVMRAVRKTIGVLDRDDARRALGRSSLGA
ncbi:hypothetical protein GJW-30_1_02257 [Variibacter gotjawalensis]|uniref:Uncharacterized protein n=1 Tax=Variibacter gotjawalensis TaxID=1333996 RepID=A0A0S3PV15_9BRAD|nr:hypothetical protein [Variibacter gotjawalensis]RZS46049.1 hypothetical protein EV661_4375 [Variibacter gotjawalensis]BAT59724.1 hypothetical protein GJW-30_1_02257 [Variibacter gotjawalensis]